MRAIDDSTPIEQPVTRPHYLCEIELETTLKLSSRSGLSARPRADSVQWTADGSRPTADETKPDPIYGLEWTGDRFRLLASAGWESVNLQLRDDDFALHSYLLGGEWRGKPVRVWLWIDEPPQQILLFDGQLIGAEFGAWTTFQADRPGLHGVYTPRLRIERPVFNHLRAPGSRLVWESEVYILEAE